MIDWDRYLKTRDLQHELELALMEERLAEYVDLPTELQIRREQDLFRSLKGFKLLGVEGWGYRQPPAMDRVFPKATTDWDFMGTNWNLDAVIFFSPPSSLRIYYQWADMNVACKAANTYPLDQGRIVSYVRIYQAADPAYTAGWGFRINSPIGSAGATVDSYRLQECQNLGAGRDNTKCRLAYWVGGGAVTYDERSYSTNGAPPIASFDRRRITWWVSALVLIVRLERYYGGAWINALTSDYTDSANRFTGNPNRRCGIRGSNREARWDDTEIWGP